MMGTRGRRGLLGWFAGWNVPARLDRIEHLLTQALRVLAIQEQEIQDMATKLQDEIAALTTQLGETNAGIDSAIVLIKSIPDLVASAGVDPAVVATIRTTLAAKTQELADAMVAVPPTPTP